MTAYEIFVAAACSCASEWKYLGLVQAETQAQALEEAARRWPEYFGELVALSAAPVGAK